MATDLTPERMAELRAASLDVLDANGLHFCGSAGPTAHEVLALPRREGGTEVTPQPIDRAAAIAALKQALTYYDKTERGVRPGWVDSQVVEAARQALSALEADDGRALLIELRKWVWRNVDPADGMNKILAEIDRLLAAPEQPSPSADDGRALLRQLRAEFSGLPSGGPRCMVHRDHLLSRIDKLLVAPEQPAPEPAVHGLDLSGERPDISVKTLRGPVSSATIIDEPAAPHADDEVNAGTSGKGRTDGRVQEVRRQADHLPPVFPGEQVSRRVPDIQVQRGSVADDAASGNECVEERAAPAQPDRGEPERVAHADDEARIEEWTRKAMANAVHFANERVRYPGYHLRCSQVDEAATIMRSLAAGKAKAEAELAKQTQRENEGVRIFDGIVADLRAKLAEVERERDVLREEVGDKGFSLLQQERDEAVADMLSVAQQVGIVYEADGHAPKAGPTPEILRAIAAMQRDADDAPRLRSAGVSLKYKLTEATAERDAAVAKLADAEQNVRHWRSEHDELAKAIESDVANAESIEELDRVVAGCKQAAASVRMPGIDGHCTNAKPCTLHSPQPAWQPGIANAVPAAADAKPGDEVLRAAFENAANEMTAADHHDTASLLRLLAGRALEVRP